MKKIITLIIAAVLMLGFAVAANAAVGTVVYATKVDSEPNTEPDTAFIDETWGEPAIVLNASSENTLLYKYWQESNTFKDNSDWVDYQAVLSLIEPDGGDVELYYLWDSKYFYFGIKTPDNTPSGSVQAWRGDGFQMWISPLAAINQTYVQSQEMDSPLDDFYAANESLYDFYVTLDSSDWDSICGGAAANCDNDVFVVDGYLYGFVKIPLSSIGLNPKTNLHGVELATALMRLSSIGVDDQGYAGWLSWGRYFYDTQLPSLNTIVLVDPAQGDVSVDVETQAPETDAPETEAPETDAPETEAPETDAPETQAPETQAPETEAPETQAPETEAPETQAPETDAPETEAPETEAPETDAPETDAPETEAPETDAPETDAPETDAPETDAPETDAPETDAPETDASATDAPAATPAEPAKNNTGLIIGIVAAVVVVGAIVGIVLGKKKPAKKQ